MGRDRVVGGSPRPPGSRKTVRKRGTPPTVRTVNPHSRTGTRSPHLQGRVMDRVSRLARTTKGPWFDVYASMGTLSSSGGGSEQGGGHLSTHTIHRSDGGPPLRA